MDLSKHDKKIAREIIEKGLQKDFAKALNKAYAIINDWKNKKYDNRDAYHKLFKQIDKSDSLIARRYDNMSGSKYLFIIAGQFIDGIIEEDDLKELSNDTILTIKMIAGIN
jgi:hypothetical protein